ncbi:outer membrane channel protein [Pragia fontium]|uniref:TolC family protein n=1 Tax=Pragia fontium TaxID=82985 RepID=UPI000DFB88FE|nr:TolC family protein [Pragia fontium]SUB81875.1 outer membrane channel protein [Pragia fontium]
MKIKRKKIVYSVLCALLISGCRSGTSDTQIHTLNSEESSGVPNIEAPNNEVETNTAVVFNSVIVASSDLMADSSKEGIFKPASSVGMFSLTAALKQAQEYSLRTVISRAKVDEAELRIDEAKAGYYPKLQAMVKTADWLSDRSAKVARSFDEYSQMQLTLQYNLMDFGRTSHAVGSAHEIHRSALFSSDSEINSVSFDTTKAYLDVRRYTLLLAAAKDYVTVTSELVDTLKIRVAGGGSPESELIRGQLALTNAKNRQKTIDLQLTKAKQKLRSLLGQEISIEMVELADIPANIDFNTMIARVRLENPNIKARLAELNGAKEDVSAARSGRYPSVDVVGGYKRPFQHPENLDGNYLGGNVALQVSVPVLDGGINSSRIGQALARLRMAEASYGQLQRDVSEMAFNLSNDALNAKDLWRIQGQAKMDASRTKNLYLDEFRLGTRSLNDLISVQTDFFNASVGRVTSQYDYYLSVLGLYLLSGQVDNGITMLKLR